MTAVRRIAVSALVGAMLLGHGVDIALERDDWPFSQYGMYKERQGATTVREVFVGVTQTGEVPLNVRTQLRPFDPSRLAWALARTWREQDRATQQRALTRLIERYDALRTAGVHDGPPLIGMRVYKQQFRLDGRGQGEGRALGRRKLRLQVMLDRRQGT